MKKLYYLVFIFWFGCSPTKIETDKNVLNCYIFEIEEFQYAFKFKALNKEKDTILIISLKENYYNKYGYKKPILNDSSQIKLNESFPLYLTIKKPNVSTMEQLGAFIIIEKDTIWKSLKYRDVPSTYMSHNTIGKYHGNVSN